MLKEISNTYNSLKRELIKFKRVIQKLKKIANLMIRYNEFLIGLELMKKT